MKITVQDRTERFLSWWAEARNLTDLEAAWRSWKEAYRFLPFGDSAQAEAEAAAMFEVAFPQYESVLPRIMKRGRISDRFLSTTLKQVGGLMGKVPGLEVHLTLGPAFINPLQYSFARDGKAYLFFPTDYPFTHPKVVLAQLIGVALFHAAHRFDTPLITPDLWVQAMSVGMGIQISRELVSDVPQYVHLMGNAEWYAMCQAEEEELLENFLRAAGAPPNDAVIRAFFWPTDFLPLERTGVYLAATLVEEAVRLHGLAHVVGTGPDGWPALLKEAARSRLDLRRPRQAINA